MTPSYTDGSNPGILSILVNNGAGFAPTVYYECLRGTGGLAVRDLDGDGHEDIVTTDFWADQVSIFLGDGHGVFQRTGSYAAGHLPSGVAIDDVDKDGRNDLLVADNGGGTVSVLRGLGGGAFGAPVFYGVGDEPISPSFVDVDNDGYPDIATDNAGSDTVSVLLNQRDGTFGPATTYPVGDYPVSVTPVDLDGDGYTDMAVPNSFSGTVTILRNNGDGTFARVDDVTVRPGANFTDAADIDGDGRLDLVVPDNGDASFCVLLNATAANDGTPPTTVASATPDANAKGWRRTDVTVTLTATDNDGGSGVKRITYSLNGGEGQVVDGASATVTISEEGLTTLHFFAEDNADNAEASQSITIRLDKTPPHVEAGSADDAWHAANVATACIATDTLSGLDNPADASFTLTTSVPDGTETDNASTGSRDISDAAGNVTTAGPIAGNKVDKKAPSIAVFSPTNTTYVLNQSVNAQYGATDRGSGLASCIGPVPSGSPIDTASAGAKAFSVAAADNVGNSATVSVDYEVTYALNPLYDPTKAHKSGSNIPLKLQLIDANQVNVSSQDVTLHGVKIVQVSQTATGIVEEDYAPSDADFVYDPTVGGTGGYRFNLSTKGYPTGTFRIYFGVDNDPVLHYLEFSVK